MFGKQRTIRLALAAGLVMTTCASWAEPISGTVKDVGGDPVAGATVEIAGYNSYSTTTTEDGKFSVPSVYENDYYSLTITKNKYVTLQQSFSVEGDKDFGDLVGIHAHQTTDQAEAYIANPDIAVQPAQMSEEEQSELMQKLQTNLQTSLITVMQKLPSSVLMLMYSNDAATD